MRARRVVRSGSFEVELDDGAVDEAGVEGLAVALSGRDDGADLLVVVGGLGRPAVGEDVTGVDVRLVGTPFGKRFPVACAETSLFDIAFLARVEAPDADLLFLLLDIAGGVSRTTMVRSLRLVCSASVAFRTLSATS